MDSKTKLYVFAKKEVALIFIFMILIAVTSFVLGVKIGKNYSMEMAGITKEDQKKVIELLSKKEEELSSIKANPEVSTVESSEIENKLQEKINEEFGSGKLEQSGHGMSTPHAKIEVAHGEAPKQSTPSAPKDALSGKYTIQLGSHRTLKEAESFAEGFSARI
jgi:cell division protein FtsN